MEGALFKKVDTTALFCRPNKRSPDEPRETEVKGPSQHVGYHLLQKWGQG
jgi:hypothetical protein